MRFGLISAFLTFTTTTALASGKPLPATEHDPALTFNLPTAWIQIVSQDVQGYRVHAEFLIGGAASKTDRLRFVWRSGAKAVGTGTCESDYSEEAHTLRSNCTLETPVKATGPIAIDLIYSDDQQDKDYLVTTLTTTVRHWKGVGKSEYWGHVPDDLMSLAFVYHQNDSIAVRRPVFEFWAARKDFGGDSPAFRCTVDGKKLPDFEASIDSVHGRFQSHIESEFVTPTTHRTYAFSHLGVDPGFKLGAREKVEIYDLTDPKVRMAIDNPGNWDCFLRVGGKPVREFLFVVNDKGLIEQSEMQHGAHPIPTMPSTVLIDMKIPKDNGFDERVRPEAMRKSVGFGVAWPDARKAKELRSALPPASGLPD
jgi:hypothetical protein